MYETWLAHDGNGSADYDQDGRPIIVGKWYVVEDLTDEIHGAAFIVAGPFDTEQEAAGDEVCPRCGAERMADQYGPAFDWCYCDTPGTAASEGLRG
jgi:hypothetical protein